MDLGEFLGGIRFIDLVLILFSFLFAANVAEPLGTFLGSNWTQFSKQYSYMIGFGTVFLAAAIAFAVVVQGFYRPQPLFEKARFVDEILGGVLGVLQAGIILLAVIVILDSFFLVPGIPEDPQELDFLRDLWKSLDESRIVDVFRSTLIPAFFTVFGLFIPSTIKAFYPGSPA